MPSGGSLSRLIAIGLVAGFFSALFGVGGGIVVVPLLLLLLHLAAREAAATALGAMLVTALAGVAVYAWRGEVELGHAALVGLPAVAGVLAGTAVQQRIPVRELSVAFALLLGGIGVWLIVG